MEQTQWQPSGEASDKTKNALSRAIRGRLAPVEQLGQLVWASAGLVEPVYDADLPGVVQLKTLSWRLLDQIDWQGRSAARCVFSGQAWVNTSSVDFTGDSVRDLATGAFFEFKLITIGLSIWLR